LLPLKLPLVLSCITLVFSLRIYLQLTSLISLELFLSLGNKLERLKTGKRDIIVLLSSQRSHFMLRAVTPDP
jgi:hypothetical protein